MTRLNRFIQKIQTKIPTQAEIFKSKWLHWLEPYFNKPYYWNLNRKNVALAVAVGMFCGLMPGPTQMISAFFVAYLLKVNISVAVFTTLYTNPFTYIPLYYAAYRIGVLILNGGHSINKGLSFSTVSNWNFEQTMAWLTDNLDFLLVGVPILGLSLAIISYFVVLQVWKIHILSRWNSRNNRVEEK